MPCKLTLTSYGYLEAWAGDEVTIEAVAAPGPVSLDASYDDRPASRTAPNRIAFTVAAGFSTLVLHCSFKGSDGQAELREVCPAHTVLGAVEPSAPRLKLQIRGLGQSSVGFRSEPGPSGSAGGMSGGDFGSGDASGTHGSGEGAP